MVDSPICPHLSKLTHFYRGIYPKALRRLLHLEALNQNANTFVEFINNRRETLFHLRGKYCCCGSRQHSVLKQAEWNVLFKTHINKCPNNGTDCFHMFKAPEWLTVDMLEFSLACVLLRNICHRRYENIVKTAQLHRNEVIHTEKSSIGEDEFELLWRKAVTSASDIAARVSTEFKNQIREEADLIYKYKPMLTRYLENTLCEVENHEKDDSFSPLKVVENILNTLEQHGIAIIVGYPGSGKSSIGLEVIRHMHTKDRTVIKFNRVQKWNELVNPKFGYVVFVDDFLGVSNTSNAGISELKPFFSTIYACVKNSKTQVVLTVRKSIYERWRDELEETRLFEFESMIDLTTEQFCTSMDEKKVMLLNHLQSRKIQVMRTKTEAEGSEGPSIDQFTVDAISQTSAFNFPLLCFLFTKSKNLRLGLKFFEQPRSTIVTTIDAFRKCSNTNDKWKYAVLSYTAVSGNVINPRKLNMKYMTIIAKSLTLKLKGSDQDKVATSDAVEELKDEYLRQSGRDTFEFIHQTFLEATVLSCGKVIPELVIEHCNNETLFELLRTAAYEEREGELVFKLGEENYRTLADRLILEIVSNLKVIPHVLLHPAMEDSNFSATFFSCLQSSIEKKTISSQNIDRLLIEASKIGHLGAVTVCFKTKVPQQVLEEAVNLASYNDHANVVELLARDLKPDPYFLQACSFGCGKVVIAMLKKGFITDLELIKEGIFRSSKAGHATTTNILISVYKGSTESSPTFKQTMVKILKDAFEAEKTSTVREIISYQHLDLDDDDLISLALEACFSNQLDLAKFLVHEFCQEMNMTRIQKVDWKLLRGNRLCIDLLFQMEELLHLDEFINSVSIDTILISTHEWSYIIEKMHSRFPMNVQESVSARPDLLLHFLWIGCHSIFSQLVQENTELLPNLQKCGKVAEKYSFAEFAAFCGFPDLHLVTSDLQNREDLLLCCIQGYRKEGRVDNDTEIFGYKKRFYTVNYFEIDSRQKGYLRCLQILYDASGILSPESPVLTEIIALMHGLFGPPTLSFMDNKGDAISESILPISSSKMEVLQFLDKILLQHLDTVKVNEMFLALEQV
ncbi:uncharacterized protein LOC125676270 isoform X2 [Ostrea edulis]|nr:uncharacterized protein LOC125676270 isoform X2 [Ostrea edulis]